LLLTYYTDKNYDIILGLIYFFIIQFCHADCRSMASNDTKYYYS